MRTVASSSAATVLINPLSAGFVHSPVSKFKLASDYQRKDYHNNYRRLVFDMQLPDWGEPKLKKFDAGKIAATFSNANINQVMAYAQSSAGHCYWPTKVGEPFAGMEGRDYFGELLGELKKKDITVTAYYSVVFNNNIRKHPEWRMMETPGKPYEEQYNVNRYGLACPNQPGYHKQAMAEAGELLKNYEFDIMFFDMAFWRTPCFCDACQTRYKKETGKEMPTNINWLDADWTEYQAVRERWTGEFMKELTELTKKLRPGLPVYHNAAGLTFDWNMSNAFEHAEYSDFLGGDFYGDAAEQLLGVKLFNNLSENRPIEFMTSRAWPNVKEHINTKSVESLEMASLASISQHAAFTLIDSINPNGTVDKGVYDRIGKVYANVARYEPELGGNPVEDIAIYFSSDSKMKFRPKGDAAEKEDSLFGKYSSKDYPHLYAIEGAIEKLQSEHLPYGVITRKQLKDLQKYKLLILPDVLCMDKEETEAIREYVKAGGKLYASRWTSLTETGGKRHKDFMLSDVFGINLDTEDTGSVNFFKPATESMKVALGGQDYLSQNNSEGEGTGSLYLKKRTKGEVLGTLTKARFQVPGTVVDHKYESLHTTPPAFDTELPMVVRNKYGKGEVIYSAANIETGSSEAHKSLFLALIEVLRDGKWAFGADTHPAVWTTLFDQPDRKRLVFSLLNHQEQLPVIPLANIIVSLRPPEGKRFKSLKNLPDNRAIEFEIENDGTLKAEIPLLEKMIMIAAEY